MTPDQRRFYVRGVMEALDKVKATAEVAAEVCRDLGLKFEDLKEFQAREKDAAK